VRSLLQVARWLGLFSSLLLSPLAAQRPRDAPFDSLRARAFAEVNDPVAHYDLAMGYWSRKQWEDAERELLAAISIAPSYPEPSLALSAIPPARREKYCKQQIKRLGPHSVRALFAVSAVQYRHAFLLNPLVDLEVLARFEAVGPDLVMNNRLILRLPPSWVMVELTRSANDFREGRYDLSLARLQKVIRDERFGSDEKAPDDVLWFHGLSAAHLADFETAIRDFAVLTGRSFAREHDQPEAQDLPFDTNAYRYVLATMLYLSGQPNEAIPTFRRVLDVDAGMYVAHVQLARIYSAAGRWDDAVHERQAAVDVNGEDASLWVDLGATLVQGRPGGRCRRTPGTGDGHEPSGRPHSLLAGPDAQPAGPTPEIPGSIPPVPYDGPEQLWNPDR